MSVTCVYMSMIHLWDIITSRIQLLAIVVENRNYSAKREVGGGPQYILRMDTALFTILYEKGYCVYRFQSTTSDQQSFLINPFYNL